MIHLSPHDWIVLSYLKSCVRETITGGTVTVGVERSEVERARLSVMLFHAKREKCCSQPKRQAKPPVWFFEADRDLGRSLRCMACLQSLN